MKRESAAAHHHHHQLQGHHWLGGRPPGYPPPGHVVPSTMPPHTAGGSFAPSHYVSASQYSLHSGHSAAAATSAALLAVAERDRFERMGQWLLLGDSLVRENGSVATAWR